MLWTLIERFDIYLVILVLVSGYILVCGDVKYFSREDNMSAKRQSLIVGIAMMLITVGIYIARKVWI